MQFLGGLFCFYPSNCDMIRAVIVIDFCLYNHCPSARREQVFGGGEIGELVNEMLQKGLWIIGSRS